jgi:tetratricopeptide (TPR) repeat protein
MGNEFITMLTSHNAIKKKTISSVIVILAVFIQGCTFYHAESEFSKGLELFKAERYVEAYHHASAASKEIPSSRKYRSLLGWVYLKQGKLEKADQLFSGIYEEDKNDIGALQGFAWLEYSRNRLKASEKWFQKQLEWSNNHVNNEYWMDYNPSDQQYIVSILSDAYYGLGLIALSQRNYPHSKAMLLKALEYENDFIGHGPIKVSLGDVFYSQKRYEKAATFYQEVWAEKKDDEIAIKLGWCLKFAGDSKGARKTFLQGLKTAKDSRPFLYGLILTDFSQNEIAETHHYLKELIRLDPYFADTTDILQIIHRTESVKSLLKDFAAEYFKKGDYQRASEKLTGYLQFKQNDCEAQLMKAWCDLYLNRLSLALEMFNALSAKKSCPEDEILTGQGVTLLYLNRLDEADLSFIKAYRINPKNVRAKVARGAVVYIKEHYKEAIRIYAANLELLPKHEQIFSWGSHALNNLGWSYLKTGHYQEALNIFNKLKTYNAKPVYPVVFNGIGWSSFYLKRLKDAENAFNHSLALDPRNSSARAGLLSIARLKG